MAETKRGFEPGSPSERREDDGGRQFDGNSFMFYETPSKFFMVGREKGTLFWMVLVIDRLVPFELNVHEEKVSCSGSSCQEVLEKLDKTIVQTGMLKPGILCYGIVGFVKFEGPYYMVLITERRQIGCICGHAIYAISKSEMIPFSQSSWRSNLCDAMNENRYKRLFCMVDITKNFFFSYAYGVMWSLQKNLCDNMTRQISYESLFVWNAFLTSGIRSQLKNTLWTVALVHGFFKQVSLSVLDKEFNLILVARRSRHCAGTRFRKRGVDKKGRVANDVETEQIVFENFSGDHTAGITSVVQHRGSIPLFWSQEASLLKFRPDINLKVDRTFKATKLHFENLVERYGNRIIILNLIKSQEKKPRESILRDEFIKAIDTINKDLLVDDRLNFLHWDISKDSNRDKDVLTLLDKVATNAFSQIGFFYGHVTPDLRLENAVRQPLIEGDDAINDLHNKCNSSIDRDNTLLQNGIEKHDNEAYFTCQAKPPNFQIGVLRTNCIDCIDRTNVAQYAYGLVALGHQLHALCLVNHERISSNDSLIHDLMNIYEEMGDTLARQYGGSAAHNKIFSKRRGQWEAATKSQQLFRTCTRYLHNGYLDYEKQNAIDLFLGNFQPQQEMPTFLGSGFLKQSEDLNFQGPRLVLRRSISDGSILLKSEEFVLDADVRQKKNVRLSYFDNLSHEKLNSSPDITMCKNDASPRCSPTTIFHQPFVDHDETCYSNFLNFDVLSSSSSSCEDDSYDRFSHVGSSLESQSSEDVVITRREFSLSVGNSAVTTSQESISELHDFFSSWVLNGGTLFHNRQPLEEEPDTQESCQTSCDIAVKSKMYNLEIHCKDKTDQWRN